MRQYPIRLIALLVTVLALASAGSASAQITIGETGVPAAGTKLCIMGPYDNVPGGASASTFTVPTAGVITSWSNQAPEGLGQELTFKVFRPAGTGLLLPQFQVVGQDGPRSLTPNVVNTFPVEIPVKAGDLIGDNDVNAATVPNACLLKTSNAADVIYWKSGSILPGAGAFEAGKGEAGSRMNISATLLVAPTIAAVTPATGPAAGGTVITISGSEFAYVKGVTVGSVPVPFTVVSESTITATTTAGIAGSPTPVTVTTIAGTATGGFAYDPDCKVPKLKGRKLKPAKQALLKAHCRPGTVTRAKGVSAKAGKVVKQNPMQGTSRQAGAKVSLKLG
jgi:IPT/TIG domain/PASTA domain